MLNSMPDERRRQQNRESQRRYRKRHRTALKDQRLDVADTFQSKLPSEQVWTSHGSTTNMMWAEIPHGRGDATSSLFPQTHIQPPNIPPKALEQSQNESREYSGFSQAASNSGNQISRPSHQYMYVASLPPAEPFLMGMRMSENDNTNTNAESSSRSTNKDLDFQPYNSVLNNTPTSRAEPIGRFLASPLPTDGNSLQDAWITPPSSRQQMSFFDDKISQEKHHRQENSPSGGQPFSRSRKRPRFKSAPPVISSRAVGMITEVENLYDFGVGVGILPEDRDMRLLLERMKTRFMSLLLAVSADNLNSSRNEGNKEDSDNDGSYSSSDDDVWTPKPTKESTNTK